MKSGLLQASPNIEAGALFDDSAPASMLVWKELFFGVAFFKNFTDQRFDDQCHAVKAEVVRVTAVNRAVLARICAEKDFAVDKTDVPAPSASS